MTRSVNRRREILKRIGGAGVVAGAAAPMSALATGGGRKWCKHPLDHNKCVHASISGAGSVMMSAQPSDEVCSKKCSHYGNPGNWPSNCHNGYNSITCNSSTDSQNTKFCVAFKCDTYGAKDSNGVSRHYSNGSINTNCLLNKSLPDLCKNYSSSPEAHWATALGNANKLKNPIQGAPFPYSQREVVDFFNTTDLIKRTAAYTFFRDYMQTYA